MTEQRIDFRSALLQASRQRADLATAHREDISDPDADGTPPPATAGATDLMTLATQIQKERRCDLRAAIAEASRLDPAAAARYQQRFNAGIRG